MIDVPKSPLVFSQLSEGLASIFSFTGVQSWQKTASIQIWVYGPKQRESTGNSAHWHSDNMEADSF